MMSMPIVIISIIIIIISVIVIIIIIICVLSCVVFVRGRGTTSPPRAGPSRRGAHKGKHCMKGNILYKGNSLIEEVPYKGKSLIRKGVREDPRRTQASSRRRPRRWPGRPSPRHLNLNNNYTCSRQL